MGIIRLASHHLFFTGLLAFCLLSNLVDALKHVAPKPTDRRLYVFLYTFIYGIAGNTVSALRYFLKVFFPQNEKILEECSTSGAPVAQPEVSGADAQNSNHGR